ncbi:hypothetical protein [Parasphingorhabdus sp.]|uniref:hypothetical protein n=1 Tax=Parasphingorhabdus sp. TaxID=2709688 RepID=UPI003263711F
MTDKYPNMPGWKGNKSTGRNAALAVAKDITGRIRQVREAFAPHGRSGATCDDISPDLNLPPYLIRPRATGLEKLGKLYALPEKRMGQMGHKVTVYSVIKPLALDDAA